MNFPPSHHQMITLFGDDPYRLTDIAALQPDGPNQLGRTISPGKIDFGMTVAEDMKVSWLMIIQKNNQPKPGNP